MAESHRGPYWDPTDYLEASGRRLEIQTDKEIWKVVPCTHEGCETDLIVNTFYAPSKAKCAEHSGAGQKAITSSKLTHRVEGTTPEKNGALANLECPLCRNPMTLHSIDERTGWLTFHCFGGMMITKFEGGCGTSVTIKPHGAWVDMRSVPTRFSDLVAEFNITQKVEYYDRQEAFDVATRDSQAPNVDVPESAGPAVGA